MVFKKKTNKELAEEIRHLKHENTKLEGRERLEKQLKEAKERNFKAKHPFLVKASKGVINVTQDVIKDISKEQKNKKKKGGLNFDW